MFKMTWYALVIFAKWFTNDWVHEQFAPLIRLVQLLIRIIWSGSTLVAKMSYLVSHTERVNNELSREKMGHWTYANSKALGKHPRSLARSFALCLELYQGLLLMIANSEVSDETSWMHRLGWSFVFAYDGEPIFSQRGLNWCQIRVLSTLNTAHSSWTW